MAGSRKLCSHRQGDGEDNHARGVVFIDFVADNDGLGTLRDDAQRRNAEGVHTLFVGPGKAAGIHARDALIEAAVMRGISSEQARQLGSIRFAYSRSLRRPPRKRCFAVGLHVFEDTSSRNYDRASSILAKTATSNSE